MKNRIRNVLRQLVRYLAPREASVELADRPKDFLIADPGYRDVVVGLAHYIVAAIRYRVVGGWRPLSLRLQIESANIRRQIGPARLKECAEWLEANPMEGEDLFEGL